MAKINDILATERDRKEKEKFATVHLYKTGSFYTAYDWSAWLIAVISYTDKVRMATRDRRPLVVTRIQLVSDKRTFCRVGFPFKSIEKFAPERSNFNGEDNSHVTFDVPLPQPADGTEVSFERLQEAVDKWTESLPIKPPKEESDDTPKPKATGKKPATNATSTSPAQPAQAAAPVGGGLIQQIINYPLSERTPMENIEFIQRLKQQIAQIL